MCILCILLLCQTQVCKLMGPFLPLLNIMGALLDYTFRDGKSRRSSSWTLCLHLKVLPLWDTFFQRLFTILLDCYPYTIFSISYSYLTMVTSIVTSDLLPHLKLRSSKTNSKKNDFKKKSNECKLLKYWKLIKNQNPKLDVHKRLMGEWWVDWWNLKELDKELSSHRLETAEKNLIELTHKLYIQFSHIGLKKIWMLNRNSKIQLTIHHQSYNLPLKIW